MSVGELCSPTVIGLVGARLWVSACEDPPEPGRPCWLCGAIRDDRGRVVSIQVPDPATGRPVQVPTGIREGDPLACAACGCLEPYLERTAHLRGEPPKDPPARGRPRSRLTARDRKHLSRQPAGRVWLAMHDAEGSGDAERAGRLQSILYRHDDGAIGDDELERLAAAIVAETGGAA